MATRTIATSLVLDGEKEFKKELSSVNGELRNLKSEMALTTEEFKGNANSVEALEAKSQILTKEVAQQTEKVKALERALKDASDVYGETDGRTDKYRQSLNRAKTDLVKMQRELRETDQYMDEARKSTDKTAHSIDGFGKEVKDASGDLNGLNEINVQGLVEGLKGLKGFAIAGAVTAGVKKVTDGILELEESTREYRRIMGTLEISSQNAGYSAEETAAAYDHLYSVLGDSQTTATTLANLQAIGLEQEDLIGVIDSCTGAWATYGDSIPIDGLAESINETIQVAQVTGTFADVLNWAGTSEDDFNTKLSKANSTTERAQIVLDELAKQGLTDAGQAWQDLNQDIVDANKSQNDWEKAVGDLGEALQPAATAIRNFGTDCVVWLTDKVKDAIFWLDRYWNTQGETYGSPVISEGRVWHGAGSKVYKDAVAEAEEEANRIINQTSNPTPALTKNDMTEAMANAINLSGVSGGAPGSFAATITMQAEDGREFGRYMVPFVRDENKSNPEVVSDR